MRHTRTLIAFYGLAAALLLLVLVNPTLAQDAAGGGETETIRQEMNFLQLLREGGWFMVAIGLCSLLGLAIVIERLLALRKSAIVPKGFLDRLRSSVPDLRSHRKQALDVCQADGSPVARVIAVGIRKLPQGEDAVETAIEDAGANEVGKLRRNLRVLYGVSAITPMIGLLGTVWGMIESFQVASMAGLGGQGAAEGLAGGIFKALVTTFAGLTVAIPVLMFYYYFIDKIERIVSEMNDVGEAFIEHYLVKDEPSPAVDVSPAPKPQPTPSGTPVTV